MVLELILIQEVTCEAHAEAVREQTCSHRRPIAPVCVYMYIFVSNLIRRRHGW